MIPKILPYYYPTTVVFVDDDRAFLENLVIGLEGDLASVIFDSPVDALAFIEAGAKVRPHDLVLAAHPEVPDGVDRALTDRMVTVELSKIPELVYRPKRFDELTVVVVDYAMPGLNGLEFCERLGDTPVRIAFGSIPERSTMVRSRGQDHRTSSFEGKTQSDFARIGARSRERIEIV